MTRKTPRDCPSREDFVLAMQREIDDVSRRDFFNHVPRCPVCRPRFQVLARIKSELEAREGMVPASKLSWDEARTLRTMAVSELRSGRDAVSQDEPVDDDQPAPDRPHGP